MEEKKKEFRKEYRRISVKTIDGSTILGKVNIGIKQRVSDMFTKTDDPFIILFDVEDSYGSEKVFFINKKSIVWVEPED